MDVSGESAGIHLLYGGGIKREEQDAPDLRKSMQMQETRNKRQANVDNVINYP